MLEFARNILLTPNKPVLILVFLKSYLISLHDKIFLIIKDSTIGLTEILFCLIVLLLIIESIMKSLLLIIDKKSFSSSVNVTDEISKYLL